MRVYHFLPTQWALDDLLKGRLKVSLLDEMNDPFELLASDLRDKTARNVFHTWHAAICDMTGALCFSDGWHDPLLWSHYADRHRGVALGFEVERSLLTPMRYVTSRLPDMFSKVLRDHEDERFLAASKLLLETKYKRWEYESEYRLFAERRETESGMYFFDFKPHLRLKTVLLGVRFNGDRAEFERALRPQYQGVEIIQTRMAFKSYNIVRQKMKRSWFA